MKYKVLVSYEFLVNAEDRKQAEQVAIADAAQKLESLLQSEEKVVKVLGRVYEN